MKILIAHNYYQQAGGERAVFEQERQILERAGHKVIAFVRRNEEIVDYGAWLKLTLGLRTIWAWDSYRELLALLRREKPDVAHFHNTFPLISPAAYYACREAGVPVVQTLHNYRLLCPAAIYYRDGKVCEDCTEHSLWQGLWHACYRGSATATAATALALAVHRRLGTWTKMVDCYIALTEFSRRKFIEGGLPGEKIFVKPNFVCPDPGGPIDHGQYALFVGRLSPEKRVLTVLAAWRLLHHDIPLLIIGGGPQLAEVETKVARLALHSVHVKGSWGRQQTLAAMHRARFLVFASEWYENFPMAIVEAFACGVPVVASRLGAMREIMQDGVTGLHFEAGKITDLAAKVEWAWAHPEEMAAMGTAARAEYEAKYTPERNYEQLMEIYRRAIGTSAERVGARTTLSRATA